MNVHRSQLLIPRNSTPVSGLTIVEIIVAITVASILIVGVFSFIITYTNQYAVTSARTKLESSLVSGSDRIDRDIKTSRKVLAENSIADAAAPGSPAKWVSDDSQLVLGTTARKENGESLDGTYPGVFDNIIYYMRGQSLYRRILAHDDGSGANRFTTITCSALPEGGCAADEKVLDDVSSFTVHYYDETNAPANPVDGTKRIRISIELSADTSGQTISTSTSFMSTLL